MATMAAGAQTPAAAHPSREMRQLSYSSAMKILVIEDDRDSAQYLEKALAESGHSADIAADPADTSVVVAITLAKVFMKLMSVSSLGPPLLAG